ncbi:hypothetical protein Bca4012_058363 [Brassica carinata]|uniref:Uncharacterized protein n=1 Tax=Brassica carinata TaxID=52824 RepID=A0A8X7W4H9_BRACI|nr:hypothetical protein Bca52824_016099 [Brassica carinata]
MGAWTRSGHQDIPSLMCPGPVRRQADARDNARGKPYPLGMRPERGQPTRGSPYPLGTETEQGGTRSGLLVPLPLAAAMLGSSKWNLPSGLCTPRHHDPREFSFVSFFLVIARASSLSAQAPTLVAILHHGITRSSPLRRARLRPCQASSPSSSQRSISAAILNHEPSPPRLNAQAFTRTPSSSP